MSLLLLPDELILAISKFQWNCGHVSHALVLICRRLHALIIPMLYAHPHVNGYSKMRRFTYTLAHYPHYAEYVKTLKVYLKPNLYSEFEDYLSGSVTIPRLPRCTRLEAHCEDYAYKIAYQVLYVLAWASNCPQLEQLCIGATTDASFCLHGPNENGTLSHIKLPSSLKFLELQPGPYWIAQKKLELWQFLSTASIDTLVISVPDEISERDEHSWTVPNFWGVEAIGPSIVNLTLQTPRYYNSYWPDLPKLFPNLEYLKCNHVSWHAHSPFTNLRRFEIICKPFAREIHASLHQVASLLRADLFPFLKELLLETPRRIKVSEHGTLEDIDEVLELCRARSIKCNFRSASVESIVMN